MKTFTAQEVAQHNTANSCWVILYGQVYDVTDFLSEHPGGSKIILALAGTDATEEYDPVHPPGTLEEQLPASSKIGALNPNGVTAQPQQTKPQDEQASQSDGDNQLQRLLNLDEFEALARKRLPRRAWAYYSSASDDLITKIANNLAYRSILLRSRVFIDCTNCSTATSLLQGTIQVSTPLFVSPTAKARLGHPEGERGIAMACATYGAAQVISNNASLTPEQTLEGSVEGQVFGWQLYVKTDRRKSEDMLARIEKLKAKGMKFLVLTLDAPVSGKREDDERANQYAATPAPASAAAGQQQPRGGMGATLFWGTASDLTWRDTLPWIAAHSSLPLVLKGVQTHEDALLAARHAPQVRAIVVSNHGGRAADTAPPAVLTLLEIRKHAPEVFDRVEVWIDGGIRRGTDVVKALALGAKAVGMGRAPLYGLGVGGKEGVERVFEIMQDEIKTAMRLLGVERVDQLGPHHVNTSMLERQMYNGPSAPDIRGLWASSKL